MEKGIMIEVLEKQINSLIETEDEIAALSEPMRTVVKISIANKVESLIKTIASLKRESC